MYRAIFSGAKDAQDAASVFYNDLRSFIGKFRPKYFVFAADPPRDSLHRRALYPQYKAQRDNRDADPMVLEAVQRLLTMCRALGPRYIEVPGYEADDVIATLVHEHASTTRRCVVVTRDKDLQGLTQYPRTELYDPYNGTKVTRETVCARWKIAEPAQLYDLLALTGDSSDNVPGARGIGKVRASQLIREFSTLEGVYANLDEHAPAIRRVLEAHAEDVDLSRDLVRLVHDVPFEQRTIKHFKFRGLDPHVVQHALREDV